MFLPKKIRVGFQNRRDTYTGKLAYVIYYDELNKLRKEKSFESWRAKDIDPQEFNNEPTEGFVLNKKTGGYSSGWNHRSTYIRVYDPRGFEVEISVSNLLYILRDCYCHPGKGLEGKFVYAWDGTELLLLSCAAKEYTEHLEKTKSIDKGIVSKKDLKEGYIYNNAKGESFIYLGHQWFSYFSGWCKLESGRRSHVFVSTKHTTEALNNIMRYLMYDLSTLYGGDEKSELYQELKTKLEETNYVKPVKEFSFSASSASSDVDHHTALLSPDKKIVHIIVRNCCYNYYRGGSKYHFKYDTYYIDGKGKLHADTSDKYVKDYVNSKYPLCTCGRYSNNLTTFAALKKDYKEVTLDNRTPNLIFDDNQPKGR